MFQNKEIRKILIIILFCAILIFINIIHICLIGRAEGYEVSIYTAYPITIWVIFIFIDVLILYIVIIYNINKLIKIVGLLLLWLNQLIVLLLPIFRGYFIYGRFDVLVHLGHIKDILFDGHIGNSNFYPIMHILVVELYFTTKIPIYTMTVILPALFWSMFLLWYFVFIRHYISESIAELSLIAWMLFPLGYWHTSMVGNVFSYYLMFLALGLWISNLSKIGKFFVFILLCITLIYFHPLTSIYFTVILIIFEMLNKIILKNYNNNNLFNVIIIIFLIWIMWYLSFPNIRWDVKLFLLSILNPLGNPFFNRYISIVEKYDLPISKLIAFMIYRYFGVLIFLIGAIIYISLQFKHILSKKYTSKLTLFVFMLILFFLWSVANLFLRFVNFERSLKYVLAFSLPLGSLLFFYKLPRHKPKLIFVIIIIILSYFAIFTVHRSPLSGQVNNQISVSEYNGMKWWFENKDRTLLGYDDGMLSQWRFYAAMFGVDKAKISSDILYFTHSRIPAHFGYSISTKLCNVFSKQTYLVISKAIFESYRATIPENMKKWRYTLWDLKRLKIDPNVSCIYSSRDIHIYLLCTITKSIK